MSNDNGKGRGHDLRRRMGNVFFDVDESVFAIVGWVATGQTVVPSGHPEYDGLTGYLTGTYKRTYCDRRRGCTITVDVEVINLGRPVRGIQVDPELLMRRERMPGSTRRDSGALRALVRNYLVEHGPSTAKQIGEGIGCSKQNVQACIDACDWFVVTGNEPLIKRGRTYLSNLWGVKGIHHECRG